MDTTSITIIVIIAIAVIIIYMQNSSGVESFTSDEAIQNIASVYNQSKFIVTDLTATGAANVNGKLVVGNGITTNNGLTVTGATNTNTLMVGNGATINGLTTLNALKTGYGADIGKNLNVAGNTNLTGTLIPVGGIQAIVIDQIWSHIDFYNKMKQYFNRSMPDGTIKTFIFVGPNSRTTAGGINIRRQDAIKLGNQVLTINPGAFDWSGNNPWINGTGDDQHRFNI